MGAGDIFGLNMFNFAMEQGGNEMNAERQFGYDIDRMNMQGEEMKELGKYNMGLAKEMWDYTSYENQKKHMKAAGINPALMYGMGGGGGQTSNVPTGSVSAGSAGQGTNNSQIFNMQDMAQLELLEAQKKKIEAETKNLEQDTSKSWQETHEIEMRNLVTEITQAVKPDGSDAEGNKHESAAVKAKLAELAGNGIKNNLMLKGIEVDDATIKKMAADIAQRAEEIIIQKGHLDVAELLAKFNTSWENIIGKEALGVVGGIIQLFGLKQILGGSGHKVIEGFRKKSY